MRKLIILVQLIITSLCLNAEIIDIKGINRSYQINTDSHWPVSVIVDGHYCGIDQSSFRCAFGDLNSIYYTLYFKLISDDKTYSLDMKDLATKPAIMFTKSNVSDEALQQLVPWLFVQNASLILDNGKDYYFSLDVLPIHDKSQKIEFEFKKDDMLLATKEAIAIMPENIGAHQLQNMVLQVEKPENWVLKKFNKIEIRVGGIIHNTFSATQDAFEYFSNIAPKKITLDCQGDDIFKIGNQLIVDMSGRMSSFALANGKYAVIEEAYSERQFSTKKGVSNFVKFGFNFIDGKLCNITYVIDTSGGIAIEIEDDKTQKTQLYLTYVDNGLEFYNQMVPEFIVDNIAIAKDSKKSVNIDPLAFLDKRMDSKLNLDLTICKDVQKQSLVYGFKYRGRFLSNGFFSIKDKKMGEKFTFTDDITLPGEFDTFEISDYSTNEKLFEISAKELKVMER